MDDTLANLPPPPRELLELATAYQRSKTLFALVDFDLPTRLAGGPLALDDLATLVGVDRRAFDRFCNAAVALGLLARDGDLISNTAVSAAYLRRGAPGYLGDLITRYDRTSYELWSNLAFRLRSWRPGETDAEDPTADDQGGESLGAQHELALMVGGALAGCYDFSRHRTLLDLGGGTGAMAIAACAAAPNLRAIVYDLPAIVSTAERSVEEAGLDDRIRVAAGNFKEDELPGEFDAVLMANLLSVSSAETNREVLARLHERLPSGGALILSGWILDDDRTSPLVSVLFCLEDVNWQAPDMERSGATYRGWLAEAGFVDVEQIDYSLPWRAIVARKR